VTGIRPKDLPCGGCQYCTKADQQWGSFTEEVDNVVGLSTGGSFSVAQVHVIQETSPVVDPHNTSAESRPVQGPQHEGRVWDPGGQVSECMTLPCSEKNKPIRSAYKLPVCRGFAKILQL
jgi:hypothetical protein